MKPIINIQIKYFMKVNLYEISKYYFIFNCGISIYQNILRNRIKKVSKYIYRLFICLVNVIIHT